MENLLQVFVMLMCALFGMGIPLSSFYPYGPTTSDSLLGPTDDGFSPPITTPSAFRYFGSPYSSLCKSIDCVHMKFGVGAIIALQRSGTSMCSIQCELELKCIPFSFAIMNYVLYNITININSP